MIVNKIIGNIQNYDVNGKTINKVNISADDRLKHIIRAESENGVEIGISLDNGHLHNGDILAEDHNGLYVVNCLPQKVILIKATNLMQMGFVAHSIGNRHTPAVFEDEMMIVEDDYLIAQWLEDNHVPFERCERVLKHALRHADHHH